MYKSFGTKKAYFYALLNKGKEDHSQSHFLGNKANLGSEILSDLLTNLPKYVASHTKNVLPVKYTKTLTSIENIQWGEKKWCYKPDSRVLKRTTKQHVRGYLMAAIL